MEEETELFFLQVINEKNITTIIDSQKNVNNQQLVHYSPFNGKNCKEEAGRERERRWW